MNITKLVHSCLLVEQSNKKILIDPGTYSWQDDSVKAYDYSGISCVVVTHNHPDHLDIEFAKRITEASPNAKWYGTQEVIESIKSIGLSGDTESNDPDIKFINSEHADLSPWFNKQPEHTSFIIFKDLLVSGDCHTLNSSHGAKILAGAINGGPWGGVVGFAKMIEHMEERPELVLPLHDWHWNEEAKNAMYAKMPEVLEKFWVNFLPLQSFVEIEV